MLVLYNRFVVMSRIS